MESKIKPQTLRIVLLGKTDSGKSSTGKTICKGKVFKIKSSERDIIFSCEKRRTYFDGQCLDIVDTPGLFDPNHPNEKVKKEIANSVALAAPGPHALLVVLHPGKFTIEEQEAVNIIQEMFGEEALRYTMALFTHGDNLKADGKSIEETIEASPYLCTFISKCGGGYHVFNNRDEDPSQVRELLEKINTMVQRNGGSYYTKIFSTAEQESTPLLEKLGISADRLTYGGVGLAAVGAIVVGGAIGGVVIAGVTGVAVTGIVAAVAKMAKRMRR